MSLTIPPEVLAELRKNYIYDLTVGRFLKVGASATPEPVGSFTREGHLEVRILGGRYPMSLLLWWFYTGRAPERPFRYYQPRAKDVGGLWPWMFVEPPELCFDSEGRATYHSLTRYLSYDKDTGGISWLIPPSGRVTNGVRAGRSTPAFGRNRAVMWTHIIWCLMTGQYPSKGQVVDHISGDTTDNRWENLRLATFKQNCGNRAATAYRPTGYPRGVRRTCRGKFRGKVEVVQGGVRRQICGPSRETPEEAYADHIRLHLAEYGEFSVFSSRATVGP